LDTSIITSSTRRPSRAETVAMAAISSSI